MFRRYLYTDTERGANICAADMGYAMAILEQVRPKIIVEIGTFYGGSARMWKALFSPDVLITVDKEKLTDFDDLAGVTYIIGRSQDHRTLEQVEEALGGRDVDLLFIDGGHLYEQVRCDWDIYSPLVRPGGVVMFHDVHVYRPELVEVKLFWDELAAYYGHHAFTSSPDNDAGGVGLVVVSM